MDEGRIFSLLFGLGRCFGEQSRLDFSFKSLVGGIFFFSLMG